ncbi:unnamed protein product [Gadus morhua 'NCC']
MVIMAGSDLGTEQPSRPSTNKEPGGGGPGSPSHRLTPLHGTNGFGSARKGSRAMLPDWAAQYGNLATQCNAGCSHGPNLATLYTGEEPE